MVCFVSIKVIEVGLNRLMVHINIIYLQLLALFVEWGLESGEFDPLALEV
jgi:hypothetical protein